MKRGTLQGSKALEAGFGIQSGKVMVMTSEFVVRQFGETGAHLDHLLGVTRVGDDLEPIDADEVVEQGNIVCWANKEDGTMRMQPGSIKNPADPEEEVEGLGIDVGTSGNTFCSDTGATPFKDSDAILFCLGLEAKGFSPAVNDQCYAPNYVGLVLEVETITKEDLCKQLKVSYKAPANQPKRAATGWKIVNILRMPGDQKKGKAAAGKSAGTASTKATGSAGSKANGSAPPASDNSAAISSYAMECAKAVAKEQAGKTISKAEFKKLTFTKGLKGTQSKLVSSGKGTKEFQDYCTSDDGIIEFMSEGVLTATRADDETITGVSFE